MKMRDWTMLVLTLFTLFFTGVVLLEVWWHPDDGQTYTVFTGLLTGFAGALMMHLKGGEKPPPPGSVTSTTTAQITQTPKDPE